MLKRWLHTWVNQEITIQASALATNRALLLRLSQALADYLSVWQSSDSAAYGADGDGVNRWVTAANVVWGDEGDAHSWIVFEGSTGGTAWQVCLNLNDGLGGGPYPDGDKFEVVLSPGALFTNGAEFQRPQATDEVVVSGLALDATNTFDYLLHVIATDEVDAFVGVWLWKTNIGNPPDPQAMGFFGRWQDAAPVEGAFVGWGANPVLVGFATGAASMSINPTWDASGGLKARHGLTAIGMDMVGEWYGTASFYNDPRSAWDLYPIGVAASVLNHNGRHGWLPDLLFVGAGLDDGGVLTLRTGERFAVQGAFAVPWGVDDPLQVTGSPAAPTAYTGERIRQAWAGGVAAFTTVVTEPIAATAAVARWTPLEVVVDVPPGHSPWVMVQLGEGNGIWLTAYAAPGSPFTGFSPLFADRSTMSMVGDSQAGHRCTLSLLPITGWHRSQVTVVYGAAREAL